SKLAVSGRTRLEAIDKLRRALREYEVGGIKTTLPFFREIVEDAEFVAGELDTGFIPRWLERREKPQASDAEKDLAIIAAALAFSDKQTKNGGDSRIEAQQSESRWAVAGIMALHASRL
ncbi:MAG: hypothetical protein ACR2KZ_08240, partial [Segetibacter sp.]